MKVIQLNHSDINGGAARAAYRIHHALRHAGVDSQMWVDSTTTGDWTVQGHDSKLRKGFAKLRPALGGSLFNPVFKTSNKIIHSPAILPSGRVNELNSSDADVLHLHWVQNEMLSISDIGRLRKPIVWTLHDMWAFCGAEHIAWDERWRTGYHKNNRPIHESGFDLNRWTWERKRRRWKNPMHIVTPSRWLADCVRESALMMDWQVSVVPNPIDCELWQPVEQRLARKLLSLPEDVPLILFGTSGANSAHHKGFDLLTSALSHLRGTTPSLELVVFGQLAPRNPPDLGFPVHYIGHLYDDLSLRVLYSAADALIIPSRIDNLPNTGLEAMACGTPVIAFNTCGLPDIVDHLLTGYLAKAFDPEDLALGIKTIISGTYDSKKIRLNCRKTALLKFSSDISAEEYKKIYFNTAEKHTKFSESRVTSVESWDDPRQED